METASAGITIMPYIKQDDRMKFDEGINNIIGALGEEWTAGELNYVISSIVWELFRMQKKYQRANDIMGALEGIKLEFYRRKVAALEDEKILENGDL